MNYGAILTTIYDIWLDSRFFAILKAIWRPFKRAYDNLALVKFLRRGDGVQSAFERSLFARIERFIFDIITRFFALISRALSAAWNGSAAVRICSGSFILNYEFLLGAFICVMFIAPHENWNNAYAIAGAIGFLVLYLILAGCGKRPLLHPDKLGLPLALFGIALVVSLLFTNTMSDSLRILSFFIAAFALCYTIAADITDTQKLDKLLAFIYAAVILTAVYAIAQIRLGLVTPDVLLTDVNLSVSTPARATSTLDNPNNYAEFLVLFMPLCAAFAGSRKDMRLSVLLAIGLVIPAVAMVLTYSRSGWVSLMLAAFVYVWLRNKKLIPAFIVIVIIAFPLVPSSVRERLTSTITSYRSSGYIDSSTGHRLLLWQGVRYMIHDRGLTGIGLGPAAFAEVYRNYAVQGAQDGVAHAQSQFYEIIIETGVLGLVTFIWLMLRTVKNCVMARRGAGRTAKLVLIACASSFTGIVFSFLVEYVWFYPRCLFAYFILLGISYAAINIADKEKAE